MDDKIKTWFVEKVAQNPEYLGITYLPYIEKQIKNAELNRDQAIRKGKLDDIKYAQGLLDGVLSVGRMLEGLKISEEKSRDPGLMDRIFRRGLSPAEHG